MKFSRRDLFKTAAVATGGVAAGTVFDRPVAGSQSAGQSLPPAFDALKPLGDRVKPIRAEELQARVARAQQLMTDSKPRFEALYVTPGTTLVYYTGIHWWPSERILAFLVPRQGDPLLVAPTFEEGRLREKLHLPLEVRIWQEDQSPTKIAAAALADQNISTGRIGIEETTGGADPIAEIRAAEHRSRDQRDGGEPDERYTEYSRRTDELGKDPDWQLA